MPKIALLLVLLTNFAYGAVCNNPQLFETQFSQHIDELEASADNTSFVGKDIYKLTGNAEVYSHNYYISANDIEVTKSDKSIRANNNVKIRTGDIYAKSNAVHLTHTNGVANIKTNNVSYMYKNTGANGVASEFTTKSNTQILKNSSYSFCTGDDKEWQITASSIILDKDNNKGKATDVKLELFGIPVFYTPKYQWVLKGRETGFLFPSFTSYNQNNKTGYQIDIPYYFNIAPEKDFTLTLKNLNTRGQVINGLYRHLLADTQKNGYFETEFEYLGEDKQTDDKRWLLNTQYQQKLNNTMALDIKTARISDAQYLRDISHNASDESLESHITLNYNKDDISGYISSNHQQLVGSGTHSYTTDLEAYIEKELTYNDIDITLSGLHTSFKHKDSSQTTGARTHINVDISKQWRELAYSFKPHLNINTTDYNLDNQENDQRTLYSAGFDTKFFFERDTQLFGKDILQTLVPRISYFYTPEKDQTHLPNFDSTQHNTTYNGLFINDYWGGIDRINAANNITIGVDSAFIDNNSGQTYGNIGIARSYNVDTKEKSNIIAVANMQYGFWKFNNTWQYDNGLVAKDNTLSYHKNGINLLSISHHHSSGNEKYASAYIAQPISGKSHIFAGINRSIHEDITHKQTIGFVYDDCCTAFRIARFKEYADNSYDTITKFEIIFKGLGTTDKTLRKKLQENIPNYLPEL
jgi:LPS-assembly protein